MKKQLWCAALAAVVGLMSYGAESSYALTSLAQGRPSIKPTAQSGTALYTYQLNCDPLAPQSFGITFNFFQSNADGTRFDAGAPTTRPVVDDIVFLNGYVPNFPPIIFGPSIDGPSFAATAPSDPGVLNAIAQLNAGNPAQIFGTFPGDPPDAEVDVYGVHFNTQPLSLLTPEQQLNTFFTFTVGGYAGDFVTPEGGTPLPYDGPEHQNSITLSAFDLLNPPLAPLPSTAWACMVLLPAGYLCRRKLTSAGVTGGRE